MPTIDLRYVKGWVPNGGSATLLEILKEISHTMAMVDKSEDRDKLLQALWLLYRSSGGQEVSTMPTSGNT